MSPFEIELPTVPLPPRRRMHTSRVPDGRRWMPSGTKRRDWSDIKRGTPDQMVSLPFRSGHEGPPILDLPEEKNVMEIWQINITSPTSHMTK